MSSEHDLSVSDRPVSPPALVPESRGSVGFGAKAQLFHCRPGSPRPGRHCARLPDGQALRAAGCFAPGLSPPTQVLRGKKGVWEQPRAPGTRELIDESVYSVLSGWPQPVHPPFQSQPPPPQSGHIPATRPHIYTALPCRAHSPPRCSTQVSRARGCPCLPAQRP